MAPALVSGSIPTPAVIAHRGASALRPEHTLEAYRQAIADGADVIEPDLVSTRDGVLVARHENAIALLDADGRVREATTNVAELPQFASRCTSKVVDGVRLTGWFTEDFTLAELKTLRARERLPALRPANRQYDDRFEIPTLQEVMALAAEQSRVLGRLIAIEPETKHPSYFRAIGLPLEPALLEALERQGWNHRDAPVVVQSFEVGNLQQIARRSTVRLAQLVDASGGPWDEVSGGQGRSYADLITTEGLREVARYAWAVAVHKELVLPWVRQDGAGVALGAPTRLVAEAHEAGLAVQVWTLRPENAFLPASLKGAPAEDGSARGDGLAEIRAYLEAGVDAVFTDDPAQGRAAVAGLGR